MPIPFYQKTIWRLSRQSANAQKNRALSAAPSARPESIPEYIYPWPSSLLRTLSQHGMAHATGLLPCRLPDDISYKTYFRPDPFAIPHCIKFLSDVSQAGHMFQIIRIAELLSPAYANEQRGKG
jgi:hypothetical protein